LAPITVSVYLNFEIEVSKSIALAPNCYQEEASLHIKYLILQNENNQMNIFMQW